MTATASQVLDRVLVLEMVRVTEAAAIAASTLVGRGDEKAADAAAVEAMREALNALYMDGTVVIGEGERDEAPMLFIGEKVGSAIGTGPQDRHRARSAGGHDDLRQPRGRTRSPCWRSPRRAGCSTRPTSTWTRSRSGRAIPRAIIDLDQTPTENVTAVAAAKGVSPREIIACVLDRPRHEALIAELRALGCGIMLIGDGDVAGVIATTNPDTTIDIYMGSGGAPEGVLAAAALRCVGGQFKGRLLFRNDDERARAAKWGVTDLDKQYDLTDLAKGDCIFAATGVTDGSLLAGRQAQGQDDDDRERRDARVVGHGALGQGRAPHSDAAPRCWRSRLLAIVAGIVRGGRGGMRAAGDARRCRRRGGDTGGRSGGACVAFGLSSARRAGAARAAGRARRVPGSLAPLQGAAARRLAERGQLTSMPSAIGIAAGGSCWWRRCW